MLYLELDMYSKYHCCGWLDRYGNHTMVTRYLSTYVASPIVPSIQLKYCNWIEEH